MTTAPAPGADVVVDPAATCWEPASSDDLCKYVHQLTHNEWLATASNWLIAKPLAVLGLLVLGLVARWVVHRLIDRLSAGAAGGAVPGVLQRVPGGDMLLEVGAIATERRAQRAATMASLLKSITTGVVFTIVLFMAVAELGYDIGPLIASAGILGVALGFGAQSLVKDFLSGIFMIFEDQYGVGDVIDAGEATGTVEAVSLRVTRLRDVNGTVWYVRNGEILRIGNMSQNWARTVLDIPIAYSENLANVRTLLQEEADALWNDSEFRPLILEAPEVWGVERMDVDGLVVRVVLKTAPMEQWKVAREMRERIKTRFDAAGIETPSPQRMYWQRSAGPTADAD
ncbi:MAG TPA: mechanosensitive ion channel family protein [Nocardioidaceae bacterium]|jgi:small conductance mechanosensitive channel|nr:mechanosensitive ion channel family protein [Nocardioidaceae bacterium]